VLKKKGLGACDAGPVEATLEDAHCSALASKSQPFIGASILRLPVAEADRLRARWPVEWITGVRVGFEGERDGGSSYPPFFHAWPLARKNAWYGGFCVGRRDRLRRGGRVP